MKLLVQETLIIKNHITLEITSDMIEDGSQLQVPSYLSPNDNTEKKKKKKGKIMLHKSHLLRIT